MTRAILAAIFLCLFAFDAQARTHHHHVYHSFRPHSHHRHHHVRRDHSTVRGEAQQHEPFAPAGSSGIVAAMERQLGTNPTGWASVWCGQYLGMIVKAMGGTPPAGFPLAINWRNYGHNAGGPAPGVIAVMRGHVGVVRRVLGNGQVELISGNHGHRVGVGVYSTSRIVAWRS